MVIDDIVPNLPKSKESAERAYANCSDRGKFIAVDKKEFATHLQKGKSDLSRVRYDYENEAWDWVIIKSYYAMHHAINALLVRFGGVYSKDHICSILALKHLELIPEKLYLKLREINAKFSDFTGFDVTYTLRKISQYDVEKWKTITKSDADAIYSLAKELIYFTERRCYE